MVDVQQFPMTPEIHAAFGVGARPPGPLSDRPGDIRPIRRVCSLREIVRRVDRQTTKYRSTVIEKLMDIEIVDGGLPFKPAQIREAIVVQLLETIHAGSKRSLHFFTPFMRVGVFGLDAKSPGLIARRDVAVEPACIAHAVQRLAVGDVKPGPRCRPHREILERGVGLVDVEL